MGAYATKTQKAFLASFGVRPVRGMSYADCTVILDRLIEAKSARSGAGRRYIARVVETSKTGGTAADLLAVGLDVHTRGFAAPRIAAIGDDAKGRGAAVR